MVDCISNSRIKLFGVNLCPSPFSGASFNTSIKKENEEHSAANVSEVGPDSEQMFDFSVEPVNFGSVVYGKLWCNEDIIFTKGYKSGVKFFNIFNPMTRSYYTSEILDGGLLGLLSLEEHPHESFVDISTEKCWEMVLQRLNQEMRAQTCLGKQGLPLLHPLNSINGFEMFGFLAPSIVQAIEALDPQRKCTKYWKNKIVFKNYL